jgi:proteasome lid subunit RPN8/RPN11
MENKQYILTTSVNKIKNFIQNHSDLNIATEICGFVGFNKKQKKYIAQIEKNQAVDPKNFFLISPLNYLKFKKNNEIIAVFHSHIVGDESLSEFDIKTSELICTPFIIFSTNTRKFSFYEPHNKEYDVNIIDKFKEKV